MSILTIASNITVLASQNIIFFGFFMLMSHDLNKKKTLPSASPSSLSPSRFSPGLFVVLKEMLNQPSIAEIRLFAKDNAFSENIRFFPLAPCWSF